MSRMPSRGPLNQVESPWIVRDGTTPPTIGAPRGSTCPTHPSGVREYVRRVGDVKDALWRGITEYAYSETLKKFGSDLKLILDSLWPAFLMALKIYAASIGGGAALFGALGAIFGGVGAVPGAAIGAEIGLDIGTAILYFLGLKFLAEYVLAHLDVANQFFGEGFQKAWGACGSRAAIDAAARDFGKGIAELMSLVLQAAVAWVLKKGLKVGLKELNESKAGRALAPYARIEYWRTKLGVTDAEIPRRGIAVTIKYFEEQVEKGNLDKTKFTNEEKLLDYWKAMDFSKPIEPVVLEPGKELVGYRNPADDYGFFYTEVGTYLDKVGVDYVTKTGKKLPDGSDELVSREFVRYRVRKRVEALRSSSIAVKAWDTKRPVAGGGTQYFIPRDVAEGQGALQVISDSTKPKP
jgi:hypothetical protein